MFRILVFLFVALATSSGITRAQGMSVATFTADVTPPIGSPLCDGLVLPARKIVDPLSARGIVILGKGKPIVLCALDWVGVGNTDELDIRERTLGRKLDDSFDKNFTRGPLAPCLNPE